MTSAARTWLLVARVGGRSLGNAASLANWLSPNEQEVLNTSDWRDPRQLHALL